MVPLAQHRFAMLAQRNFDHWANVGSSLPIPHCANVAPTLHQRCANVVPTLCQRCANVVPTLCQRCANVVPTLSYYAIISAHDQHTRRRRKRRKRRRRRRRRWMREEEVEEEVEEEPKTCTRPAHIQEEEGEEPKTLSQDQHTTSTRHDQEEEEEEEELLPSNDKFDFITENQTSATGSSQLLLSLGLLHCWSVLLSVLSSYQYENKIL